jgi:hypothetical protein
MFHLEFAAEEIADVLPRPIVDEIAQLPLAAF